MNKVSKKTALFLDRDGVVNVDSGYVGSHEQCIMLEGQIERIEKLFKEEHFDYVFFVTNQAGIARGRYTEEQFLKFQSWMEDFVRGHGVPIEKTYYCPHHPTEAAYAEYSGECECRKPKPGMLKKAAVEYNLDLSRYLMIGDNDTDIEAGLAAGCKAMKIQELMMG